MKKKNITIISVTAVVLALAAAAGYYFLFLPKPSPAPATTAVPDKLFGWKFPTSSLAVNNSPSGTGQNLFDFQIAFSSIRDPGGIPQGLPVRLQIPTIGVDSAIEDAVITPDGRMDVPAGTVNVAWFSLGPHPGQVGSAVIGGHFGIQNGVPFVFYKLNKLVVGDKIYIVDDGNNTLTFQVRSITSFDRNADATTVFLSNDGLAHLNLITCEGIWNQVNGNYPERLVIFTDQIPSEGAAPAATATAGIISHAPAPTGIVPGPAMTFFRSLSVGATGADVVALQTALEQRGLLELPQGTANGYFGALTRAAVAKYQVSQGLLPPIGFFGPLTRAKLIAELSVSPTLPNTGVPEIISSSSPTSSPSATFSQMLVQSAQSLYSNLLDGLITSLLLIAIAFMAFKIFSR